MQLEPSASNVVDVYQTMVGLVGPRPIAWVTTVSAEGVVNLAPFSFFNMFGANPPVVVFSPTLKRDGSKKDTLRNLEALGEFVVNISTAANADAINGTSKELPPSESEVGHFGLNTVPSAVVKPPRIAEAPAALECRVLQIIPIGSGSIAANLVIGQVVMIHADDGVLDEKGRPDPRKLKQVARMGGDFWCRASDLFELTRP